MTTVDAVNGKITICVKRPIINLTCLNIANLAAKVSLLYPKFLRKNLAIYLVWEDSSDNSLIIRMPLSSMDNNHMDNDHLDNNDMGNNPTANGHMDNSPTANSPMGSSHMDSSHMDSSHMDNSHMENSRMDNSHMGNSRLDNSHTDNGRMDNNLLDSNPHTDSSQHMASSWVKPGSHAVNLR